MLDTNKFVKSLAGLIVGFGGIVAVSTSAAAIELPVVSPATNQIPGLSGTLIQSVDLGGAGTPTINTIVLTDISAGIGGDPGVFSGYDLDAFVLDRDGNINTAGDQIVLSSLSLSFAGGSIRLPAGANQNPSSPNNVGTYFGTNFVGGSINDAVATLGTFDGDNFADILNADGFLSFGDGGVLTITFADVAVAGGLFLLIGEVGGQGERMRVDVPGQVPLPGAVWLFLSAIAVLFGMSRRRSAATA